MSRITAKLRMAAVLLAAFLFGGAAFSLIVFRMMSTSAKTTEKVTPQSFAKYTCAMHPSILSDRPGKCPICGMELHRVDADDHDLNQSQTSETQTQDTLDTVEGRAGFSLSAERRQMIGVTTGVAQKQPLQLDIRASGKVAYDPELFTAIEEYRQTVLSSLQLKNTTYGLKEQSDSFIAAAETRLKLLGLSESQIRKLAHGRKAANDLDLILPKGSVWVYAEIFEYEAPQVKIGQTIQVISPALPDKVFSGKVTGISPVLNPETRTVRVRAAIADPDGVLRPDTFVNCRIKVDLGSKVAVPNEAVMHSGEKTFVFVALDKGRYEPRPVTVGANTGDYSEIVKGLREGETVVTSANFLIDSESRMRAAVRADSPATNSDETGPTP